jgi:hypothetical protein
MNEIQIAIAIDFDPDSYIAIAMAIVAHLWGQEIFIDLVGDAHPTRL